MKSIVSKKKTIIKELKKGVKNLFKRDLIKNKVYSSILMLLGYITIPLLNGDGTVFIFTLVLGLPVFFSDKNVID